MWNEDRFSKPSWAEQMAERRVCRYGYDPFEEEYSSYLLENEDEYKEEEIEEMEAESGGMDAWSDEQKRKIAPAILAGYAELERKHGFHFSDEVKAKWRAYL